jgi:Nucleotide modification associated domain 3
MKIILSRKGFDSAAGGVPSPIMPDGSLFSLPIPHAKGPLSYADIQTGGINVGRLVSDLTRGKINSRAKAHLDPDLRADVVSRLPGWRPMFGQTDAAQSHLERHGVGLGDLFLFYGWFREVRLRSGTYSYVRHSPDLHVVFGWLRVGEVVKNPRPANLESWALGHPHVAADLGTRSTLYLARARQAGVVDSVRADRILTAKGRTRSIWSLPAWAHPRGRSSTLSYHGRLDRWSRTRGQTVLHSAGRGQEFVWDSEHYPEAVEWADAICAA